MQVCQRPENALSVARFSPLTAECRGIVEKNVPRKPNSRRRLASATSSKPPHPSWIFRAQNISLFQRQPSSWAVHDSTSTNL